MTKESSAALIDPIDPVEELITIMGTPKKYCTKAEYPMSLILWIRQDLVTALTEPNVKNELINDALDRLSSLEKALLGEEK